MKFHLGNFPESPEFNPDNSWKPINDQEQFIWAWQLRAFPFALINMVVILAIWFLLTDVETIIKSLTFPLPIKGFLLCLAGVLITHELIHAAAHPKAGLSNSTNIGFWPSKMLLYTTYDGQMTRNRFIVILAMPLVLISILSILFSAGFQIWSFWLIYITALNAFLASGDVMSIIDLLKLPPDAIIRTKDNSAYWKKEYLF